MNKLIIANWKMSPSSLAEAREILESANGYLSAFNESKPVGLVFCPPFVFLEEVGKIIKMSRLSDDSFLGAQDISEDDKGAFTGEVSGPMLVKMGVSYVIIGHSERRWKLGESDETVNKKLKSALRNELIPVVCLGEKERNGDFESFLRQQTINTFSGLDAEQIGKCIIAYEPVWAISSTPGARPDNPESALESIEIIKDALAKTFKVEPDNLILYGGSVNSKNISDFLDKEGINGVLVGSASVNKEEFVKILSLAVAKK